MIPCFCLSSRSWRRWLLSPTRKILSCLEPPAPARPIMPSPLVSLPCMKGHSVLFATVPNLIVDLKETMSSNGLSSYRKRFEKYDLVILDELGYVSLDKIGCELLFNLISSRNDKGSIIVTSNLTFDRWEEIFKRPNSHPAH